MMKRLDDKLIDEMLAKAAESPRRRSHYNLHESMEEPIHRLMISAMPDTVVPVHRHPDKWELMTVLRGKCAIYTYDDDGRMLESAVLGNGVYALEIPAGTWHNFVALTPVAALEVKAGPYAPNKPEDVAPFEGERPLL